MSTVTSALLPVAPIILHLHSSLHGPMIKPRFSIHFPLQYILFLLPGILSLSFPSVKLLLTPSNLSSIFSFSGECPLTVLSLYVVDTASCPLKSILPFFNAERVVTQHLAAQPETNFPSSTPSLQLYATTWRM